MRLLLIEILLLLALSGCGLNFWGTQGDPPPPVFGGISSIDAVTDSTARLNWTRSSNASGYQVFQVSGASATLVATVSKASSSYTVTGLTPSTSYTFRVRALPEDSNVKEESITTNLAPDTPSSLTLSSPSSSPDLDATPTVTVSGVKSGDTIKLFSDAACTVQIGSDNATGASVAVTTDKLAAGAHTIYANATNSALTSSACSTSALNYTRTACPSGYLLVPADASVGTTFEFCVMQFEARDVGSAPVSTGAGTPWVFISAQDALAECQELGEGYDLISNPEWMTVARNIEATASNWVAGVLNRGWSASTVHDGFQNTNLAPTTDSTCVYNTAADTCGAAGLHKLKRTHTLSSGEEIWDLSANAWEFVDWAIETPNVFTLGPVDCANVYDEIQASITACDGQPTNFGTPTPGVSSVASPLDTTLTSANGVGLLRGGNGGGTIRGASWSHGIQAGIFTMNLGFVPTTTGNNGSFRCVYRPH